MVFLNLRLTRYPKKFCIRLSFLITNLDITKMKRDPGLGFFEKSLMLKETKHSFFLVYLLKNIHVLFPIMLHHIRFTSIRLFMVIL